MTPKLLKLSLWSTDFFVRLLRGLLWPKVDLLIRLWLAKLFFMAGLHTVMYWDLAPKLTNHVPMMAIMRPFMSADVAGAIEIAGAALLAAGFMTRYAASVLFILTAVVQIDHGSVQTQLFCSALFAWYAFQGSGPISVDSVFRRGLAESALPVIPHIVRTGQWSRSHLVPVYLAALRIWLGGTLLLDGVANANPGHFRSRLVPWLPLGATMPSHTAIAIASGALILLGLGTRYVALAMICAASASAMMDPRASNAVYLLMLFAIFTIYGGGSISLDRLILGSLKRRMPQLAENDLRASSGLPRVVIVGAGFGGMACAAHLRKSGVPLLLIDRTNYHLFQPLLYQVATAALSPGDIATPIRTVFRDEPRIKVLLGNVTGVDLLNRDVLMAEKKVPYDYLVLATGASHSYFGKEGWHAYAPGLKRIEDALEIRRRILTAFERAEATADSQERASLLTFLIVGGGPTGVELAGAVAELARFGMDKEFRAFDPADARVILVQSAPRLLPAFPERLAVIAQRSLQKLGVEVLLNSRVDDIDGCGVTIGDKRIAARTVVWAAGVAASAAARWLNAESDRAGRIKVAADLSVPGVPNVFAIGDTALCSAWHGQSVPGIAPAAKQAGVYVAKLILARLDARKPPPAFIYRHRGNLATIGRKAAVADLGFVKLWGAPAWWLWGLIHIGFLVGVRNRVATMMNWFWAYLAYGGGIRLITGSDP